MLIKIRSNARTFYRWFFIFLFLVMGIVGLGISILDSYAGVNIIVTESDINNKALLATVTFLGVLGIVTSALMIYLMQEKRSNSGNRRKSSMPYLSSERRISTDRRVY